jgi:hypothetical protein
MVQALPKNNAKNDRFAYYDAQENVAAARVKLWRDAVQVEHWGYRHSIENGP